MKRILKKIPKIENMESHNGNYVPNQFMITNEHGRFFKSYDTIIVAKIEGRTYLDREAWDYSNTTGKYRNIFLGETKKETEKKIKSGDYILTDLNQAN